MLSIFSSGYVKKLKFFGILKVLEIKEQEATSDASQGAIFKACYSKVQTDILSS